MRANQTAVYVFKRSRLYHYVASVFFLLLCTVVHQAQSADSYVTPFSAYVTSSALKIRSGPGMSHSQIGQLRHGEKVRVIAYAGSWRKIQRGARDAYVSGNYLTLTPGSGRSSPHFGGPASVLKNAFNSGPTINTNNDLNVADYHARVTAGALNVRKGPGTKYSIHKSIGYGQTVKVTHHQGLWLRIQWPAGLAYVHGNYLKRKDTFEGVKDPEGLIPTKSNSTQSSSSIIAVSGNSTAPGLETAGLLPSAACNWQKPTSFINNYYVTAFKKTQMRGQPHDRCLPGDRHLAAGGKGRVVAEKGDWVYLQNTATDYYGWAYKPSLFIDKSRERTSVLSDSGFSQNNRSSGNRTNCNQTFGPTRSLLAPLQKSIEELIDQPIKGDRNNNGCPSDTAIINVALAIGANPLEAADAGRRANANILYESNCWDDFLTKSNFLSAAQLELDIKTCRIAARLSNNKFPVSAYLEFARAWGPGGACLAAELDDDWTAGNTAWCVFDIAASAIPGSGASDNLVRAGIRNTKTARVLKEPITSANAYKIIDRFRHHKGRLSELGDVIPVKGDGMGTVAFVNINGNPVFGVNSKALIRNTDKNLGRRWANTLNLKYGRGTGQFLTHAEAHSLMRAHQKTGGNLPSSMTMYVDRVSCSFCRNPDALPRLAKEMGITNLNLHFKDGKTAVISNGRFEWK